MRERSKIAVKISKNVGNSIKATRIEYTLRTCAQIVEFGLVESNITVKTSNTVKNRRISSKVDENGTNRPNTIESINAIQSIVFVQKRTKSVDFRYQSSSDYPSKSSNPSNPL
jgi:hypothetical protein